MVVGSNPSSSVSIFEIIKLIIKAKVHILELFYATSTFGKIQLK